MSSQWRAMAFDTCAFSKMKRFKPHLLMIVSQTCYTLLYFITQASFNEGLNPHVYVTYRHVVGGLVVFPFAYFLERMEIVDVRNPRGIAKIVGTIISLAGVMIMILYKGQAMQSLKGDLIHIGNNSTHEDWIKGSILTVTSCISWSVWYIMQGFTLNKYPAQLSLTVWINCIGGAQSAVFTVLIQHKPAAWSITSAIDFLSIIYSGVVCCGLTLFLQLYCIRHKGPVFVTIFNPLSTVMVTTLAYFVVGEKLYMGRILGGAIVIAGLYALLWGKEKDQECINTQQKSVLNGDEHKEPGNQISSSAETEDIP
ncbi:hypothetical protein LWI29_019586 [Acer saccharum]|uniref:WAT1-related protein n=1 Tax=Acer saccharum TaxID=4024 RepID=A0AA39VCI3_ACESA|nr:hypothetical protein LWI29_019586 [Acer saccharum]